MDPARRCGRVHKKSKLCCICASESEGSLSNNRWSEKVGAGQWFSHFDWDRDCYRGGIEPVDAISAVLERLLAGIEGDYDCVLFDCPPGFNSLTRAAIRLSPEGIIAPTTADATSVQSLKDFVEIGLRDTMQFAWQDKLSVVMSMFRNVIQQRVLLDTLDRTYKIVGPPIRMLDQVQAACEHIDRRRRRYSEKYGRPRFRPLSRDVKVMTDRLFDATFP